MPKKREAYANDLGHSWSLVAVSASSNRSKGDRDPAEWLSKKHTCDYVEAWIGVKFRWKLQIDKAEQKAALSVLLDCDSVTIAKPGKPDIKSLVPMVATPTPTPTVTTPTVVTPTMVTPTVVTPTVTASPAATPPPPVVVEPVPSGTDPRYSTCADAKAAGANTPYYSGTDPEYVWYRDSDKDGIVCESAVDLDPYSSTHASPTGTISFSAGPHPATSRWFQPRGTYFRSTAIVRLARAP